MTPQTTNDTSNNPKTKSKTRNEKKSSSSSLGWAEKKKKLLKFLATLVSLDNFCNFSNTISLLPVSSFVLVGVDVCVGGCCTNKFSIGGKLTSVFCSSSLHPRLSVKEQSNYVGWVQKGILFFL